MKKYQYILPNQKYLLTAITSLTLWIPSGFPLALLGSIPVFLSQQMLVEAAIPDSVKELAKKVTVKVYGAGSPGSGVIVKREGDIYTVLTAKHVIESTNLSEKPYLMTYDGVKHSIINIEMSPFMDLAELKFKGGEYSVPKLGSVDKSGIEILVSGFSLESEKLQQSEGSLEAIGTTPNARPGGYALLHIAKTLVGMSGGSIFASNGELVGIHGQVDTYKTSLDTVYKSGAILGIPIAFWLQARQNNGIASISANAFGERRTSEDFLLYALYLYSNNKFTEAIQYFDQAIQLNPHQAGLYGNRGLAKDSLGDNQGAMADYNEAIRLDPQKGIPYINRGNTKHSLGDNQGAIADFNEAIRLNPQSLEVYNNRGLAKYSLGDHQGAIADFNEAIRLNPQSWPAYSNRGLAKMKLGDNQGAIADFNEAIRLNPQLTEGYFLRGNAKIKLGDNQGAIADFNEVIRLNPQFMGVYLLRGLAKDKLRDNQGAITDYNEVIRLNPQLSEGYFLRGNAKIKLGDNQGAIADYNEAIKLNPQFTDAYTNTGLVEYEQGNIDEAFKQWKIVFNLDSKKAEPQLAMAVVLYKKREVEKACKQVKLALQLDNKYKDIDFLKKQLWGKNLINDVKEILSGLCF